MSCLYFPEFQPLEKIVAYKTEKVHCNIPQNLHFKNIIRSLSDYDGEDSEFIVDDTDEPGRKFFSLKINIFKLLMYGHF